MRWLVLLWMVWMSTAGFAQNAVNDTLVLKEKSQSYRGIKVGKTSKMEVIDIMGSDYTAESQSIHVLLTGYHSSYTHTYTLTYPNLNVQFVFIGLGLENCLLSQIIFNTPFPVSTRRGIVLGQSTFQDVMDIYNTGAPLYSSSLMLNIEPNVYITYKNLRFSAPRKHAVSSDEFDHCEACKEWIVDEISIFSK